MTLGSDQNHCVRESKPCWAQIWVCDKICPTRVLKL